MSGFRRITQRSSCGRYRTTSRCSRDQTATAPYYDNLTSPYNQLDNTYIGKDLCIRARGYFDDLNQSILSSYWISIGDLISPCP